MICLAEPVSLLEPHMERRCYNKDSCAGVSIIQQPFCPVSNNHHFSQQFDFLPYGDLYIVTMATLNLGIVNPAAWCPVHNTYQLVTTWGVPYEFPLLLSVYM